MNILCWKWKDRLKSTFSAELFSITNYKSFKFILLDKSTTDWIRLYSILIVCGVYKFRNTFLRQFNFSLRFSILWFNIFQRRRFWCAQQTQFYIVFDYYYYYFYCEFYSLLFSNGIYNCLDVDEQVSLKK